MLGFLSLLKLLELWPSVWKVRRDQVASEEGLTLSWFQARRGSRGFGNTPWQKKGTLSICPATPGCAPSLFC